MHRFDDPDLQAPFKDGNLCFRMPFAGQQLPREADRIIGIGRQRLLAWYERMRNRTFPGTYGDSGCDRTFSVAYTLKHGGTFNATHHDPDVNDVYNRELNRALAALRA